ncbi:unnamed protein product [Ilex paraguariensis]|uniref:NmrA-like domain-containing protein n=1 Tax=Ilex paraguariensis TaxID=185542 RepID=A0ABC8REC8_9AQUA
MTVSPCVNGVSANGDRVLIIGATGFMGQFVAQASLDSGKPTYVLLRSFPSCLLKAKATKAFEDQGAIILFGAMENEELMEKILKDHEIDIVISASVPAY